MIIKDNSMLQTYNKSILYGCDLKTSAKQILKNFSKDS